MNRVDKEPEVHFSVAVVDHSVVSFRSKLNVSRMFRSNGLDLHCHHPTSTFNAIHNASSDFCRFEVECQIQAAWIGWFVHRTDKFHQVCSDSFRVTPVTHADNL